MKHLGLIIGTGDCNAHCQHCGGIPLRQYAPSKDGIVNIDLIRKTLIDCYKKGARSLSISSSGEPTLSPVSVTSVLNTISNCNEVYYNPINLYSNGIRIGTNEHFCSACFPLWKQYGLTSVYLTVHSVDEKINAQRFEVEFYPSLLTIIKRIQKANLTARANIMLSKNTISTLEELIQNVEGLQILGINLISIWPIRTLKDELDSGSLSVTKDEMNKIKKWVSNKSKSFPVVLLSGDKSAYLFKQKLTLFQNGTLSNLWC